MLSETPPPPSVEEASRALEEALEETSGIVFSSSQSSSKPREPLRKLEHNLISSDNSHKYITEQSLLEGTITQKLISKKKSAQKKRKIFFCGLSSFVREGIIRAIFNFQFQSLMKPSPKRTRHLPTSK